jgi:acetyltransferase-like isoleucine patch superfamily enzyme
MHTPEKLAYLLLILKHDPAGLFRLVSIALTTARFRYVKRCVGQGTTVEPGIKIINSANVLVGKQCLLKEGVYIRAGIGGRVVIKDRAALNCFCRLYGHGSIEIGEDTQLGPGTLITTTDHDYHDNLATHFKPVVIGRGVWIGANVTILPGVEIGDRAVIGAGAVVNKNIPARSIAVGVPARVVKMIDDHPDEMQIDRNGHPTGQFEQEKPLVQG